MQSQILSLFFHTPNLKASHRTNRFNKDNIIRLKKGLGRNFSDDNPKTIMPSISSAHFSVTTDQKFGKKKKLLLMTTSPKASSKSYFTNCLLISKEKKKKILRESLETRRTCFSNFTDKKTRNRDTFSVGDNKSRNFSTINSKGKANYELFKLNKLYNSYRKKEEERKKLFKYVHKLYTEH